MQAYKNYKNSIEGISEVGETVKIMEKISAIATHPLEKRVFQLREYAESIENLLARLAAFYQDNEHPLLRSGQVKKRALILITNKKGLVGGLWQNLVNIFLKNQNHYSQVIALGHKGREKLQYLGVKTDVFFPNPVEEEWSPEAQRSTDKIINSVFQYFETGRFDAVDILYPKFNSLADQQPTFVSLIPFEFHLHVNQSRAGWPIFEQPKKKIFDRLLRKYIHSFFFQIVLETKLSELAARTIAMEHAANTTDRLIKQLGFQYHKDRRKVITQRQLESFTTHKILNQL